MDKGSYIACLPSTHFCSPLYWSDILNILTALLWNYPLAVATTVHLSTPLGPHHTGEVCRLRDSGLMFSTLIPCSLVLSDPPWNFLFCVEFCSTASTTSIFFFESILLFDYFYALCWNRTNFEYRYGKLRIHWNTVLSGMAEVFVNAVHSSVANCSSAGHFEFLPGIYPLMNVLAGTFLLEHIAISHHAIA